MSLGNARSPYLAGLRPEPTTPSGAYLAAPPGGPHGGSGVPPPPAPPGARDDRRRTRSFSCRDPLWDALEMLAHELDCSIDYLINDALKQYLRQRFPDRMRVVTALPIPRRVPAAPPLPAAPPVAPRITPPPMPMLAPPLPPLRIHIGGTSHAVHKTRFVIGRGKRGVDLVIDDPNVSRQHALIEHVGGCFWLVDLGSTNGIERAGARGVPTETGARVTRVPIAEGDHFQICGHSLWMTYR